MTCKRWTVVRRVVQVAVILLLASPPAGQTFFNGSLAAADLMGIPLADPLASLQVVLASRVVVPAFLVSACAVALFYFLVGGRTFCAWICPVYLLTEAGEALRRRTGLGERTAPLAAKKWSLLLVLCITAATGLPLFEILSPIGMVARAVAYGGYLALGCLLGLMLVEVTVSRRIWCRSLCPLGGFYSLVGRFSPTGIRYAPSRCTACGACSRICPVEEVLEPSLARGEPRIVSGDCTRCGACIDVCPHRALTMGSFARH